MLSKKSTTTSTSTSTKRPPPVPLFVIRNHESAITTIKFTCKSKILISGDESGTVLMTLMKTMRTIKKFKAHDLSILSIELIDSFNIITYVLIFYSKRNIKINVNVTATGEIT